MSNPVVCQTCACLLAASPVAESIHERWHQDIAEVAIAADARIAQLERDVQELRTLLAARPLSAGE